MERLPIQMTEATEQRILLCAPFGKDAQLTCRVLEKAGLGCFVCKTIPELVQELEKGAGAVLTVEEALSVHASALLSDYLVRQPTWSDLPILVLTKPGGESPWIQGAYERLGNLTLLERPVRSPSLVSAARSALRARLRQYRIRTADQRKDEFLAMLAHELRNPLAPIRAAADFLKIVASDADRVLSSSEVIARQVGHMTTLIDDLLDVARVTRGLIVYRHEPLDVRQILTEAVEQTGPLISKRRHRLALHLPPEPTPVSGDRKRLVQVIANLVGNASKYTPEGGSITLHLQVEGDDVVLAISDNGIGMTPETVSSVFDLFAQAERTPDRSQGGLGLGLALVKNLVAAHHGTVHARSEGLGKGSTFTVRLPRLKALPPLPAASGNIDRGVARPVQPLRIMVVDDNTDAANLLQMFLEANGHEVCAEYRAPQASNAPVVRLRKFACWTSACRIWTATNSHVICARCRKRRAPSSSRSPAIARTATARNRSRRDLITIS
jgi:signal transduction histidine kinase